MGNPLSGQAGKVLLNAQDEARLLNHSYIGTEHILLGLAKEDSGIAVAVLKNMNVNYRQIRRQVEEIVHCGLDPVTLDKIPMTPRAKKAIEYAMDEAFKLNLREVGTELVLLGLILEQEGVAAHVLRTLGVTLDGVRNALLDLSIEDL